MDNEKLNERIFKRISIELDNQKKQGKKFISDEEVDNLIDEVLKEEIVSIKITDNKWVEINCKYDLPKESGMYFVIRQFSNDVTIELFDGNFNNYHGYKVTHWMPIIKPDFLPT